MLFGGLLIPREGWEMGVQDEIIYPFDDKNKKVALSNLVKT